MSAEYIRVEKSGPLSGEVSVNGAKNAVLVTMASLILVKGVSRLSNVPASADVYNMIEVLEALGARVEFDTKEHVVFADTTTLHAWCVDAELMKKMRASILVAGALLSRFGKASVAVPGGCAIGSRPIDYHIKSFQKMGAIIQEDESYIQIKADALQPCRLVLEYPSVGTTENVLLAAVGIKGKTTIVNAAIEPEVVDLIKALRAMGAVITITSPATIVIDGGYTLHPIAHDVVPDRLEAGALLLAAAITGGSITIRNAHADMLDVFLLKLQEMGHALFVDPTGVGIRLEATMTPRAVSFKTGPYPNFPTDLQAPMMAAQIVAQGESVIEETVFENRMLHVTELQKMGASVTSDNVKALIQGGDALKGISVQATDIRASCALVLAGLVADGVTHVHGIHHWRRGYEHLEIVLARLGARISIETLCRAVCRTKTHANYETGIN